MNKSNELDLISYKNVLFRVSLCLLSTARNPKYTNPIMYYILKLFWYPSTSSHVIGKSFSSHTNTCNCTIVLECPSLHFSIGFLQQIWVLTNSYFLNMKGPAANNYIIVRNLLNPSHMCIFTSFSDSLLLLNQLSRFGFFTKCHNSSFLSF